MIEGRWHVSLNGVKYRLAEGGEGRHYIARSEALRPPNASVIQGENSAKFQMRPDVLQWNLTDWSGGEGQLLFDPENPNRWWELTGVRVFEQPGTLRPGYYVEDTQDTTGAADHTKSLILVKGIGDRLYGLATADAEPQAYRWDNTNKKWGAADTITGPTDGADGQAVGDTKAVYFLEFEPDTFSRYHVWKWAGSGAATELEGTFLLGSEGAAGIMSNGAVIHYVDPTAGWLLEISKATGDAVLVDDFTDDPGSAQNGQAIFTTLNGKTYLMVASNVRTIIREIVPSSAAGTGFGAEIISIPGFRGEALWSHAGTLYMLGQFDVAGSRTIIYFSPGSDYGSLGRLREGDNLGDFDTMGSVQGNDQGGRMLDHFFVVHQLSDTDQRHGLFQINALTGGISCIAINEDGDAAASLLGGGVVSHQGDIFWSTHVDAATKRTMRARPDRYTKESWVISPWNDFGITDEKVLSSLGVSMDPLPEDWQINVDYAQDGDTDFTQIIDLGSVTNPADGSTGFTVRAGDLAFTSPVYFKNLRIRIRMTWIGAGVPSTFPVIRSVEVRAMVLEQARVWDLTLEMDNDDTGATGLGYEKIANLAIVRDAGEVFEFVDGYTSDKPNFGDTYNVVLDEYELDLSKPGEGIARVRLRQVV